MFDTPYSIAMFVIGIIASLITIVGWFPQAIKTFRTNDTSGISFGFYGLIYVSSIVWIIYSFLSLFNPNSDMSINIPASLPVLITNLFAIALNTIIILIKFKNMTKAKKLNITEREYIELRLRERKSVEK